MGGSNYLLIGVLGFLGVAAAAVVAARFKAVLLVYGAMLMASALAAPSDWTGRPLETWLTPIQTQRSLIFAACGGVLLLGGLLHMTQVRAGRMSVLGVWVLLIGLYGAFVRTVAGADVVGGGQSFVFALLTILPGALVLPSAFQNKHDIQWMLRIVALVAMAWIGACLVQAAIRPKILAIGGGYTRFQGMLGNPQHAGTFLSFCVATTMFLMVNDMKIRLRPIWAALASVLVLMVLWTGSRTGLGMTAIGAAAVFYSRFGRAILFLPLVAIILAMGLSFLEETTPIDVQRFTSGVDTRTIAWRGLIDQFLQNPLFGTALGEDHAYTENSFLLALAGFGIGMGILVFLFAIIAGIKCLGAIRARFDLYDPLDKRYADLFIGLVAMYFAGAVFEGYILARVSTALVFILLAAAIGSYVAERAREDRAWARAHTEPGRSDSRDIEPLTESGEYDYSEYGDFSEYGEAERA